MGKNKTGKYLKYAIGEIILVVIGILIAVQVNNWNEKRLEKIEVKKTLNQMYDELQYEYQRSIKNEKVLNEQIDYLTKVSKGLYTEVNLDSLFLKLSVIYSTSEYNQAYLNLKESKQIALINDKKLLKSIIDYYEDKSKRKKAWSIYHENITTNTIEDYALKNLPIEIDLITPDSLIRPLLKGQLKSIINFQITVVKSIVGLVETARMDNEKLQHKLKELK